MTTEQGDRITISREDLRHLFDLANDSPLVCSGSFETDDVKVLRRIADAIGVDPDEITPVEFVRDFPHAFRRREVFGRPSRVWEGATFRMETPDEQAVRMREEHDDERCVAGGTYSTRRCNRPEADEIHVKAAS